MLKTKYNWKNVNYVKTSKYNWKNSHIWIMLHHTWMWWDENWIWAWNYLSIWSWQVSCQYVVWYNWQIHKINWSNWEDWNSLRFRHSWTGTWQFKNIDWNSKYIWIEIDSKDWKIFTQEQVKSVDELVLDLVENYNIDPFNIITHWEYTDRKWDVWPNFFEIQWVDWISWFRKKIFNLITKKIMWEYEKLFKDLYWKSSIYWDLEWGINKINSFKELNYFIQIWLERIKKDNNLK